MWPRKPRFGSVGEDTTVEETALLTNPERMTIGNRVLIRSGGRFEAILNWHDQEFDPSISIGDDAHFENRILLVATGRMIIGPHVVLATGVHISDQMHRYDDPEVPVMDQPLRELGAVVIGARSWLGQNAVVLGARLGAHTIVGANSVVRPGEYPDRCVLAGTPARVVRLWEPGRGWVSSKQSI